MMRRSLALAAALGLAAAPAFAATLKPIRVILVGDSTMATRSGYGDALCQRFVPEVSCINLAKGGRSSGSFRAEGLWDAVLAMLRDGGQYGASYVLIQFGHNDQPGKPGRSTDLVTQFPANLARYVEEVKTLSGVPVLVTPLTRRSFRGPNLHNDLAPWAAASRKVAAEQHATLLDLNAESYEAVQAMGETEADTLAMVPPPDNAVAAAPNKVEPAGAAKPAFDRTHLGAKGAGYFSGMVARELARELPAVVPYLKDKP